MTSKTTLPTRRKESPLEAKFVASCRRYGGDAIKLTSPGRAGMPDRLVAWEKGVTTYAEVKRDEHEEPTPLQQDELRKLREKGHHAAVIRCEADIALFISASLKLTLAR